MTNETPPQMAVTVEQADIANGENAWIEINHLAQTDDRDACIDILAREFAHHRLAQQPTPAGNDAGLREAVADVLNSAYYLLDDTANDNPPEVPQDSWDKLAKAVEALEDIIPESEQPCMIGVAARLLTLSASPAPKGDE